jgi:hypothetical protein
MQKAFHSAKMPHLAILRKLSEISNKSGLADYFHRRPTALCTGCHHHSPAEKKAGYPQCRACHQEGPQVKEDIPSLLGAYHQQCLGCHQSMDPSGKKLPVKCGGCHAEWHND